MYIKRHLEFVIDKLAKMFGAVLIAGPRQVGKTTLLQNKYPNYNFVSLDNFLNRELAKEKSNTFFKDNPPPILIDEIQKAPELFEQVKIQIDSSRLKGQFYMCGSQQFKMMKGVSESLAGRVGFATLLGFSLRELNNTEYNAPFIPTDEYFSERKSKTNNISYQNIWEIIHRGSLPEIALNKDFDWNLYYSSYVNSYIERDVKEISAVQDTINFNKFMVAVAASIGQLVNVASIANDVGINVATSKKWLSILVASNIVFLLHPYSNNITKRVIKTPKLYFYDTGLAAYLTKWINADVLKNGAMAGAFFENFVISEILKSYYNYGISNPPLYFYRDKDMVEIDLLIENSGTIHPIEIKKHADPSKKDIHAFSILDKIKNIKRGNGGVICLYDKLTSFDENNKIIPINYI